MPAILASCAANWLVSVTLRPILMSVFSGVGNSADGEPEAAADGSPLPAALGAALGAVVAAPGLLHAAISNAVASKTRMREIFAIAESSSSKGRGVLSRQERAEPECRRSV